MAKTKQDQNRQTGLHRRTDPCRQTYPYRGERLKLIVLKDRQHKRGRVEKIKDVLMAVVPAEGTDILQLLTVWYKNEARNVISLRARKYAQEMGQTFGEIHIRDQKSRWGSCSSARNLNFNWRLVMAPEWVMDYVIIHELCHLTHMNHSAQFWELVAHYMPDYQAAKQWLKAHGQELVIG